MSQNDEYFNRRGVIKRVNKITTVWYIETWHRKRNNSSSFSSSLNDMSYNYFGGKLFMMINISIKEYVSFCYFNVQVCLLLQCFAISHISVEEHAPFSLSVLITI
jgi:hypothetical protein